MVAGRVGQAEPLARLESVTINIEFFLLASRRRVFRMIQVASTAQDVLS